VACDAASAEPSSRSNEARRAVRSRFCQSHATASARAIASASGAAFVPSQLRVRAGGHAGIAQEVPDRPLHRGRRAVGRLLERVLLPLDRERGVLFQQQPPQPSEGRTRHQCDGQKDDGQGPRRPQPMSDLHGVLQRIAPVRPADV